MFEKDAKEKAAEKYPIADVRLPNSYKVVNNGY
jgi:hypothetical protein